MQNFRRISPACKEIEAKNRKTDIFIIIMIFIRHYYYDVIIKQKINKMKNLTFSYLRNVVFFTFRQDSIGKCAFQRVVKLQNKAPTALDRNTQCTLVAVQFQIS